MFPFPVTEAMREPLRRELLRRAAESYEVAEYWRDAAECWEERGDGERASELYARAGDLGRSAQALLEAGKWDEALARYRAWESSLGPAELPGRVRCLLGQSACLELSRISRRPTEESREAYFRARSLIAEGSSGPHVVACWCALAEHGLRVDRYDLVEEGYEEALALCQTAPFLSQRVEVCRAYLKAVRIVGDRLRTRELEERLAEWEDAGEPSAGDLWVDPVLGMEFSYIPPGTFQMGSPEDEEGRWDDEKLHRVTLTRGFWLSRTPVTQGQYARFVESGRHEGTDQWKESGGERHPVAYVSWHDARAFCAWLSETMGEAMRLPTEAEWESAARAGTTSARYAEPLDDIGWYDDNSDGHTHPVAEKAPNGWGLYDLLGNVDEWVEDSADWDESSNIVTNTYQDEAIDPLCQGGSGRVIRGGSFGHDARDCRAAFRIASSPVIRDGHVGFRVLRT